MIEADSAGAALAALHHGHRVDVLFTDIRLKGPGTGHDVGDAFRALCPGGTVIYTSGQLIEPRRCVPGSLILGKPYRPEDVISACHGLTPP